MLTTSDHPHSYSKVSMNTRALIYTRNVISQTQVQPDSQVEGNHAGWQALTDEEWCAIAAHLPKSSRSNRDKPSESDERRYFEGLLWILWTGSPWSKLPDRYGSKHTVQRRLNQWVASGILLDLWRAYLDQIDERRRAKWDECFVDGVFVTSREGVNWEGRLRQAREHSEWYRPMAWVLRSEYTWKGNESAKDPSTAR